MKKGTIPYRTERFSLVVFHIITSNMRITPSLSLSALLLAVAIIKTHAFDFLYGLNNFDAITASRHLDAAAATKRKYHKTDPDTVDALVATVAAWLTMVVVSVFSVYHVHITALKG
jgi:hypothetical protein